MTDMPIYAAAIATPAIPALAETPEPDVDPIALQQSIVQRLRDQIIPTDVFVAANNTVRGNVTIYNYVHSVVLGREELRGGMIHNGYETTVFDFSSRTISNSLSGDLSVVRQDPDTGAYHKETPAYKAQFAFHAATYYAGCLGDAVDQLSAAHTAQLGILERTLSGVELAEESEQLEAFWLESQQVVAAAFSEMVGGFLDSHGHSGQTEKIGRSVQALFAAADQDQSYYSLQELDFAAASVSSYQSVIDTVAQHSGSEVRQAMRIAMVDMQVERMSLRWGGGLPDAFRVARPGIHQELLGAMDEYYAYCQKNGPASPPASRDLFDAAYETVMHTFRMTGNALTAVRIGAEEAKSLLRMEQEPAQRWTEELEDGGVWDSFDQPSYRGGLYESFKAEWLGFLECFGEEVGLNAHG